MTFVLTDGSGHTDQSRLASTTVVLNSVGAGSGSIYGAMSDRQLYQALLSGNYETFERLVEELASELLQERVTYVVGDAVEGVNPGHDVCRLLLNAALLRMDQQGGARVTNLEYPVEARPEECPPEDLSEAIILNLDDAAYARKMDAARSYPEMAKEIERVFKVHNVDVFRVECLRPVRYGLDVGCRFSHPCVYETYGEKQVAAGFYTEVVRFREHLEPLAKHLAIYCGAMS